ncbi:MAG TPA: bifunctional riboflavin kinase/FAD synthetase [Cytophagaceae bacterium]|jgi:riboflavin kinase/FMN adenylyltransferase
MKVFKSLDEILPLHDAIVTIGNFDGVHLGHKKIFQRLQEFQKKRGGTTVVVTFWPHPKNILQNTAQPLKILTTLEEKIDLIAGVGIDIMVVVPFTKEFSEYTAEDFLKKVLIEKLNPKMIIIGYDHKFGRNREGGFDYLLKNCERYHFHVEEIPRQDIDSCTISSSEVRSALADAKLDKVKDLLGRNYSLEGTVVKGRQLGRTIGYPTANIEPLLEEKIVPRDGVYAVLVEVDGEEKGGMLNVGNNPTIEGKGRSIEVYIFEFDEDIYDQLIKITFIAYLREELKFDGINALKDQLKKDEENSLKILNLTNKI